MYDCISTLLLPTVWKCPKSRCFIFYSLCQRQHPVLSSLHPFVPPARSILLSRSLNKFAPWFAGEGGWNAPQCFAFSVFIFQQFVWRVPARLAWQFGSVSEDFEALCLSPSQKGDQSCLGGIFLTISTSPTSLGAGRNPRGFFTPFPGRTLQSWGLKTGAPVLISPPAQRIHLGGFKTPAANSTTADLLSGCVF